jgi:hypothetical protein
MTQLRNVGNEELKAVVVLSDFPSDGRQERSCLIARRSRT